MLTDNQLALLLSLLAEPKVFPKSADKDLTVLCDKGFAADFGESGYARGYRWHEVADHV